jgi:hypothetical protein
MADREGPGWLAWRLESIARTHRGEPMPSPPRPDREPEPEAVESDHLAELRALIEDIERERGIVPEPNSSLAERLALAIPWDETEQSDDAVAEA